MTAPVIPVAPAPSAPSNLSVTDMMSKVAGQTMVTADPPPIATPVVKIVREAPTMPLAAPSSADIPVVDVAPIVETPGDAPAAEAASSELMLDEGEITLTAERNADGTFKNKIDPTAKFDFKLLDKATGEAKTYSKTIPELARLAKDGIRLQPLVQEWKPEVEYYRANVPQWQEHAESLTAEVADLRALNVELLTAADEIVIQRREEYASEMSPQKRLERLEAERREEREAATRTEAQRQHATKAQSFIQARLAPAIKEAEALLGVEAVAGKIAIATAPLLVNGQIPPEYWGQVEQFIAGPFKQWVTAEAAKHSSRTAANEAARRAAEDAQRQAQAVVNESGRAVAPIGRAGTDSAAPKTKPVNVRDAIDRINNRPLPASVQPVASG